MEIAAVSKDNAGIRDFRPSLSSIRADAQNIQRKIIKVMMNITIPMASQILNVDSKFMKELIGIIDGTVDEIQSHKLFLICKTGGAIVGLIICQPENQLQRTVVSTGARGTRAVPPIKRNLSLALFIGFRKHSGSDSVVISSPTGGFEVFVRPLKEICVLCTNTSSFIFVDAIRRVF